MNEEPLPLVHEVPEFTEYCQVAFVSSPVTLTVPSVVMPSELEDPVSLESASDGADGAVVSTVMEPRLATEEVFPAWSVCLPFTAPLAYVPWLRVNEEPLPLVHEVPEFTEYCQVAFVSSPVTLTVPSVVMPSELEDPVSLESASDGADGAVVSTVNVFTLNALLAFPAESVTVMVQL